MTEIRPATIVDVERLVEIHISTWKTQFTPFLTPDQVRLKDLDVARQTRVWRERITNEEGISRRTLIAEIGGKAVGYITGRSTDDDAVVELHQIYVLPSVSRHGIGKQLVNHLAKAFLEQGKRDLIVWVMTINPAVAFYRDRLGGDYVTGRLIPDGDGVLKEAQYRWSLEDLLV